jgi:hypothetical protein
MTLSARFASNCKSCATENAMDGSAASTLQRHKACLELQGCKGCHEMKISPELQALLLQYMTLSARLALQGLPWNAGHCAI